MKQQAPSVPTGGQGFGSQLVPSPRYVVPAVFEHKVSDMTVQIPAMQQAPVSGTGQGLGSQPMPSP
jgi:hypothetical protein